MTSAARAWPTCPRTGSGWAWSSRSPPGRARSSATTTRRNTTARSCSTGPPSRASFQRQAGEYDVRPGDGALPTSAFSGGNQQKIVLARELERNPDLLLVGQPTRGVDIGAIEFIHRRLVALRDAGKAVLLVSVELDEILALADRILVMYDGRIVGDVPRAEATERMLGLMMAGVHDPAGAAEMLGAAQPKASRADI